MAKTIATILGAVFILAGLAGFVTSNPLGAHFTAAHNIVHLVTGAISLYLGLQGSLSAARMFGLVFGIVYLLLGVVGFGVGDGSDRMFDVIPGTLMFGTTDHVIHILFGAIYLIGALMTGAPPTARAD